MSKKLIHLISFVLMLGLVLTSVAEAADPDLVGWWKLDETSGTTANDATGNGNHGTLFNGPQWVSGVFAGALHLDGSDDYVAIQNLNYATIVRSHRFPGALLLEVETHVMVSLGWARKRLRSTVTKVRPIILTAIWTMSASTAGH